eukprot:jgi/Tetstr1/429644/TSEL_019542.t1
MAVGYPRVSAFSQPRVADGRQRGGRRAGGGALAVAASRGGDEEPTPLSVELITGDLLLLWLHSLSTEAFRVSQRPDFPGWGAPLSLPPGNFARFLVETMTVMGFWSIAGLLTGAFTADADAGKATTSTGCALLLCAFALSAWLRAAHPECSQGENIARVAGLLTLLALWRALVAMRTTPDQNRD